MDNKCIWCQEIIPEGRDYCPTCEIGQLNLTTNKLSFTDLKSNLWSIVRKEGIEITNQNIDWILERVYKNL